MIIWCISVIVFSLVLIAALHGLFIWATETLSLPRTIDLVDEPTERYEQINSLLSRTDVAQENHNTPRQPTKENPDFMKQALLEHVSKYT
jgi:hypothetical protein